jgi:hypothetical protein
MWRGSLLGERLVEADAVAGRHDPYHFAASPHALAAGSLTPSDCPSNFSRMSFNCPPIAVGLLKRIADRLGHLHPQMNGPTLSPSETTIGRGTPAR